MRKSRRVPAATLEKLFALLVPQFQCDMNCVVQLDGQVDFERLTNAVLATLAEEPMWSHRFVGAYWHPYWEPIPRAERPSLVEYIETDDAQAELRRQMREPVDVAVRVFVLREPSNDTLLVRADHRLGDATAAQLLLQSLAKHYNAASPVPSADAPLVRRTCDMLDAVVPLERRRANLMQFRDEMRRMEAMPSPLLLPIAGPEDTVDLQPMFHYPDGTLDGLRQRAMRDRGTPTLAVLAATFLGLRDVTEFNPQGRMSLGMAVNLRRYLPPEQQPCPASMFLGRAKIWIDTREATAMAEVMERLRSEFALQRGPNFGLVYSEVTTHIPILRGLAYLIPFGLTRSFHQRRVSRPDPKDTPDVQVSDLGELGKPGDPWGSATLRHSYCTGGCWDVHGSISVNVGNCGSRLLIAVACGPRSFATKLAAAIHRHLCEYTGWPMDCAALS